MSDSTPVEVDVNTDDLDAFSDLYHGKAVAAEPEEPQDDQDVSVDDTDATDETDTDEVDEATEADAPEAEDTDEEDILKPAPKKKQTAQERIAELTRLRHEADRRALEADRRLADLEAKFNSSKEEPIQRQDRSVSAPAGSPDPDALNADGSLAYPLGEFDPLFIRDLTRFTIRAENEAYENSRKQEAEAARASEADVRLQGAWAVKLSEVEKDIPDLRPTIATLEAELSAVDPALGTYLAQTIMGMDAGPQVLYFLANNVDEAQKIVAAGPVGATLLLGKLEDKIQRSLEKKAAKPDRIVSKAPEPAVTTRGNGGRVTVADDTEDLDAFSDKFFKR